MSATIKIKYLGMIDDINWPHFLWSVAIGSEIFQYKTGLGHKTNYQGKAYGSRNKKPDKPCIANAEIDAWIHIPSVDDVLYSLLSDSESGGESFDEFCDNCGYSNDSLKALDVYRACSENGKKLRRALGKEYQTEMSRIRLLVEEGKL